jgi:hypothetical protein
MMLGTTLFRKLAMEGRRWNVHRGELNKMQQLNIPFCSSVDVAVSNCIDT